MLPCGNVSVHIYFASCALFVKWWLVYCRTTYICNIDNYIPPFLAVAILRNHDQKCAMHYWVNEVQNATYKFSIRRNLGSSSPGARAITLYYYQCEAKGAWICLNKRGKTLKTNIPVEGELVTAVVVAIVVAVVVSVVVAVVVAVVVDGGVVGVVAGFATVGHNVL